MGCSSAGPLGSAPSGGSGVKGRLLGSRYRANSLASAGRGTHHAALSSRATPALARARALCQHAGPSRCERAAGRLGGSTYPWAGRAARRGCGWAPPARPGPPPSRRAPRTPAWARQRSSTRPRSAHHKPERTEFSSGPRHTPGLAAARPPTRRLAFPCGSARAHTCMRALSACMLAWWCCSNALPSTAPTASRCAPRSAPVKASPMATKRWQCSATCSSELLVVAVGRRMSAIMR